MIDLRVIAMTAEPPEQLVDVDLANPPQPEQLLAQLGPTRVCAIAADPHQDRPLRWTMRMCKLDLDGRCDGDGVYLADGVIQDPDTTGDPEMTARRPQMCATVMPDGNLLGVLLDVLKDDPLHGLGGVDYGVVLRVGGEDANPALDQYASKTVRVSPRIPADRTPNHNPSMNGADLETSAGGLTPAHCDAGFVPSPDDPKDARIIAPGQKVQLNPIEPPSARETYVVPTLDGNTRTFTEALTYQWIASAGSFSTGSTGGVHDPFGNPPQLFTDYTAPDRGEIPSDRPTWVSVWIVQRDERLGASWYESCLVVDPSRTAPPPTH